MKLINKAFVFESDEEIKSLIKLLKEMKKTNIMLARNLPGGFEISNGKPVDPPYSWKLDLLKRFFTKGINN